jgi:hypothetical protein
LLFKKTATKWRLRFFFIQMEEKKDTQNAIPDLTDIEQVRKAIIANEILNRKY